MRNILVLVGSGMLSGNTNKLSDAFIDGAREAGHIVHKVFLGAGALHGCTGCGACQLKRNGCVIDDTMLSVYPLFEKSDTIVLASPLYFWTLSSQIKACMDRLYAVSTNDIYPPKDTLLLMTAGDDTETTFDRALSYYTFITAALGWRDIGQCLAGGCSGEPGNHSIDANHLQSAHDLGKSLA